MNAEELDTTLIRRGTRAATFLEMAEFAKMLEERPLERLLAELPGLATLSTTKFALAVSVLRRRFRSEPDVNREQLRTFAGEIAEEIPDPDLATRIRTMFGEK
ncbi:MAG: hypothetical protein WBX15_12070 [Thermoanaerobaculia bacterium]